jgi:hypothetical protein
MNIQNGEHYLVAVFNETYVVRIQAASVDEPPFVGGELYAIFRSGPPRLPVSVEQLKMWGARFTPIKESESTILSRFLPSERTSGNDVKVNRRG